ncbi:MAG: ethanolamine ammonia-lyase subunit EutC [Zoogloeaceae bacterium]|jgi:ethanolamine ammonia-lyase small subunit|nr:ethanolamine ammonia-lyase subunit EutC [Zoogloeaceae bacterium]
MTHLDAHPKAAFPAEDSRNDRPANPNPFPCPTRDPWEALRRRTFARIALGRAGGSQRTASVLEFRLAHARARDAVHARFEAEAIAAQFAESGLATERLAAAVSDRPTFLMRPDLGRRLAEASRETLRRRALEWGARDLVILVSDGHSANAALRHAAPTIVPLANTLRAEGWTLYPILLIPFARVKLQDEVGALLHARHALMFLGERPGLSASDSLGAYFTWRPDPACTDADRNCVSNIRAEGTPPAAAARKLAWLLLESARLGIGGVALKDDQIPAALPAQTESASLPGIDEENRRDFAVDPS